MTITSRLRRLLAVLRRVRYCPTHDLIHASDFCAECMKPRLRALSAVDRAAVKPEWQWPLHRDEDDRLVIQRSSGS